MISSKNFRKEYSRIPLPEKYNNGTRFLDPFRKRLVPVTPEEKVRQRIACYLRDALEVPHDMIFIEDHLSHYSIKKRARVDIVVCEEVSLIPVAVVECKSKTVGLSDQTLSQAIKYADDLNAMYIFISDGSNIECYAYDKKSKKYHVQDGLPNYKDMLNKEQRNAEIVEEQFIRTDIAKALKYNRFSRYLGEDTPADLYNIIVNFSEALLDCSHQIKDGTHINGIEILEDLGLSYRRYGDASGGGFGTGDYRLLLVKFPNKKSYIYGFSIQVTGKTKNDPKYGNSTGKSVLIVSVSGDKTDEMLVQINLNAFSHKVSDKLVIIHNGRFGITNARSKDFIARVGKIEPALVREDSVYLGEFPANEMLYIDHKDLTLLLSNLIKYCNLRKQYKDSLRKKHNR